VNEFDFYMFVHWELTHKLLNFLGRVLNRFSKDVGFLDDLLPQSFLEYLIVRSACTRTQQRFSPQSPTHNT
jgi:hypothetical protein